MLGSSTSVCSNTSLSSDTCPSGSKVGTASALVPFLPSSFSGDVYLQTRTGTIGLGIVLRGPNSTKLVLKGTLAHVDSDGDGVADRVRIVVGSLPQVPWSSAAVKLTSLLVKNPELGCTPPSASSTFTGWSGASATVTNEWSALVASCAPQTTITSGPSGTVGQSSVTFDFTSSIAGSNFECTLDDLAPSPCSPPQVFSNLADGMHQVCIRAVNGVIPDPTPECHGFTVDTTAPIISDVTITPRTTPGPVTITYSVSDDSDQPVNCNPPSGSTIQLVSGTQCHHDRLR